MRKLEVLMFFLQNLHFNPTSMALLNNNQCIRKQYSQVFLHFSEETVTGSNPMRANTICHMSYSPTIDQACKMIKMIPNFSHAHKYRFFQPHQECIYVRKNLILSTLKSGYSETVCPDQPENLQNCLSKLS